jgi:dTDP-4-amino-4,6-dideoxygalactose transaminase
VQAAFGLTTLKIIDKALEHRKVISMRYAEGLREIPGIRYEIVAEGSNIEHNYSYVPIFVDEKLYGMNRDQLYEKLKQNGILGRRYFFPLISTFEPYRDLKSAKKENLPVAHKIADEVICLPIFADLSLEDVDRVIDLIKN